jgi:hypothetical protein
VHALFSPHLDVHCWDRALHTWAITPCVDPPDSVALAAVAMDPIGRPLAPTIKAPTNALISARQMASGEDTQEASTDQSGIKQSHAVHAHLHLHALPLHRPQVLHPHQHLPHSVLVATHNVNTHPRQCLPCARRSRKQSAQHCLVVHGIGKEHTPHAHKEPQDSQPAIVPVAVLEWTTASRISSPNPVHRHVRLFVLHILVASGMEIA